jgi:hypothetical protein
MFASGNASAAIQALILIYLNHLISDDRLSRAGFNAAAAARAAAGATHALAVFKTAFIIINFNHILFNQH